MVGDCCVLKFLWRDVDGKHLMRFQRATSVFKFLRRSVDGKGLMRFQRETSIFKSLRRSVDTAFRETRVLQDNLPTTSDD